MVERNLHPRGLVCACALMMTLALAISPAMAQSTWDGGSGNWSDANWNGGANHTPASDTNVDGAKAGNSTVTLDVTATTNTLTIDAGDTVNGAVGNFNLQVGGDATINGTLSSDTAGSEIGLWRPPTSTTDVSITNNGTLSAAGGGALLISRGGDFSSGKLYLTNNGAVSALGGGFVSIANNVKLLNLAGGTLTGGTWIVDDQGSGLTTSIHKGGSGNITTNAANITLAGPNAVWTNLNTLANNTGSLSLKNAHSLNVAGNFNNAGGTLNLELSGTSGVNGQLVVTGNAVLDGLINILLAPGFAPPHGDHHYDVVLADTITGVLDVNVPFTPGATYSSAIVPGGGGGEILRISTFNTPEPASLTLLAFGGALLLRRRRIPA